MESAQQSPLKTLLIASLGSGLEMYDFVIYVFFAPLIAEQFFPNKNYFVSLLMTFGVFAVGYLSRTFGAFLFGHIADTRGRKKSLYYTISAMAIPIILITFLPTYNVIGIYAPIILTLLRAIQGIGVGGEFSGAITLVSEFAPVNKRSFYCSGVLFAMNMGILIASIVAVVIHNYIIDVYHWQWAWRIAFFVGCLLAIVGAYVRHRAYESPIFTQLKAEAIKKYPLVNLVKEQRYTLLSLIFIASGAALVVGVIVFFPTYLQMFTHLTVNQSFTTNVIFLITLCVFILISGILSDYLGNYLVLAIGLTSIAALTFPLGLIFTTSKNLYVISLASICLGIPIGIILGSFSSYLVGNFKPEIRATGVGLSYNIPFTLITGTFPALSIFVIKISGHTGFQYSYILILSLFALSHLLVRKNFN